MEFKHYDEVLGVERTASEDAGSWIRRRARREDAFHGAMRQLTLHSPAMDAAGIAAS